MATKWEAYGVNGDKSDVCMEIYNLHEGTPAPWEVSPRMRATKSLYMSTRGNHVYVHGYQAFITSAASVALWCNALVQNQLPKSMQLHRTEFVELPRVFETCIPVDGAPRYMHQQHARNIEKHWVVPFFGTAGSGQETVSEWPDTYDASKTDIVMGHPPRVIIRKVVAEEKYTVDFVCRSHVYYYGKYASFERAMNAVNQIFQTALLTPEDLPHWVRFVLSRKYYGIVRHERLPKVEQMLIADYDLALHILTRGYVQHRSVLPPEFFKQFWDNPKAALGDLVNNKEALFRCFYDNRDVNNNESIRGMKRLIPLLRGKYTKALVPMFRNAMRLPLYEVQKAVNSDEHFGIWVDLIAEGVQK